MELKKTAEVEISQLKQLAYEQEALLAQRQAQLEKLEEEVVAQQKMIDDLNFQKSQLEHEINQYRFKLEIAVKDKAASEQELSHTKEIIEQSEAKWSLAQTKINMEESTEEELQSQFLAKANKSAQQPLTFDSQLTIESEPKSSANKESDSTVAGVLKPELKELVLVQKRAEMAEEKAQMYKKLLDDSNNRVKKLQTDMETERINMSQKSDNFQQETLKLKRSIIELQEETRSLQRVKSSLEQSTYFQTTEVDGLKEQLKITQGELHKKSSTEQENSYKINNLEEELASKQALIDQLKFKCNELTRINVSSDSDIQGLLIQTESLEKDRSFSEQKIKSLKSEIESWKQQLQSSKDEYNLIKRSEKALQLKCKNLEAELQNSESLVSQLQKKVHEFKLTNMEIENNLKKVRAKLDQVMMESESKDQQIKIFKSQVEGSKSQVRIIEEELNKKSQNSHDLQIKLQDYSEEVKKMIELQQKIQALNSNVANYEKEIAKLKSELKSVIADKNLANRNVHMQSVEINDLNVILKKKNLQLNEESADRQKYLNKIKTLEDELFKNRLSIKAVQSSTDKSQSNLQHENLILKHEKAEALEKNISLESEAKTLKEKLQYAQTENEKKLKENSVLQLRAVQMEEQLEKCKKMLEELKAKLELQKEGYERQLLLVQTEIEKKIILLQSSDKSSQHCAELGEMLNKYFKQSTTQITVETKQQMDQQMQLQIKMDKLLQEKTNFSQDLSKAKSQITQLEEDKLKLNLKISALQSLCNEQSKESAKIKQMLTDSEWKLTLKETQERSLREQIESYVKEVKNLQETLLGLGVGMKPENVRMNKQDVSETSDQYVKDNIAASLKTELTMMQKVASSYEVAKCKMEDDSLKKKVPSEVWMKSF